MAFEPMTGNGAGTYNGGMQLGVRPFDQTSSRMGAFFSGASSVNSNISSKSQMAPSSYQNTSVLSPMATPNGQSATTFERNRILNLNRQ